MATTSALTGNSVDVDAIVSGLMTVERLPITQLQKKESSYQAKITALGTLNSKVAAFQTAAQNLGSSTSSSLQTFKASASDSSILSATAGTSAVAGTYSLAVTSLAQSQKLVATGQTSSTAAIGGGTSRAIGGTGTMPSSGTSTGSIRWVVRKPSIATMAGVSASSAVLRPIMLRSAASCAFLANTWMKPVSSAQW